MKRTLLCLFLISCSAPASKGFTVTVSGEDGATGSTELTDGWEIKYEHVLVTVAGISFSQDPDKSLTDQSQTGEVVAQLDGPYAVDLAKPGPLDAKAMNGKAWKLGDVRSPGFDPTTRYAFGYRLVAAASGAEKVGFDSASDALYATMISKGWAVVYQGTATWKGDTSNPACRSTDAAYDWNRVPKQVRFTFGWKVPVTFKNCVNPELTPAETRGVQTQRNDDTVAQVTFHLDHPFWDALEEDAPLRFDAIAGRKSVASGAAPASVELTEADLQGVDFQTFKDAQGNTMPLRFCGERASGEPTTGTLRYDPKSVPVNPAGGAAGLKDLYEYMTYNLGTFGHLNNDGLCYPARDYPSP